MSNEYFGTDGIRGRANVKLTPGLALKVGRAAGLALRSGEQRQRALISKDTRVSSYMIEGATTRLRGMASFPPSCCWEPYEASTSL